MDVDLNRRHAVVLYHNIYQNIHRVRNRDSELTLLPA